ncbi:MAG: response regulator [Hasllibacter sp.]
MTRILVCDDNPANRVLLQAMLAPLSVTPVMAGDGREALALLAAGDLAGALIDIRMPVMDGEGCIREWRARERDEGRGRLKAVAVTANADGTGPATRAGFDRHMLKPIDLGHLRATIAWMREP